MLFINLRKFPSISIFLRVFLFYHELLLNFVKWLIWSYVFLFFLLVNILSYIDWSLNVEPDLQPQNKPYVVTVYNSLYMLLNSICLYFVKDFWDYSWEILIVVTFSFLFFLNNFLFFFQEVKDFITLMLFWTTVIKEPVSV